MAEKKKLYSGALEVYHKHKSGVKLTNVDLVALLKFLCAEERLHKSDFASHYKNSKEMWDKINNSKKPWEEYFGKAKDDIDVEEELAPIIGCAGDDDDGLIFGNEENDENGDEFQMDEV